MLVAQLCLTLCDLMDYTLQAPLSMEFSRQDYWRVLPFPSPGDLPDPGTEARSPSLQADSLLSKPPGKPSLPLAPLFLIGSLVFFLFFWFFFYHFCVSLPLFVSENISTYVHTLYLSLLLTLSTILNQLSWRQAIFLLPFTAQSS